MKPYTPLDRLDLAALPSLRRAAAGAVEFQIPKPYATPATYTVAGSTVKKEQSEPRIDYWDGSMVEWIPAKRREVMCLSNVGQLINCFQGKPGQFTYIYRTLNISKSDGSTDDRTYPLHIKAELLKLIPKFSTDATMPPEPRAFVVTPRLAERAGE